MPDKLQLISIKDRHEDFCESKKFLFMDTESKHYQAEIDDLMAKDIQKRWYNLLVTFSYALRHGQEVWISGFKLKPGTVVLDVSSDFATDTVDRGFAFVPKPVAPLETKKKGIKKYVIRKDWNEREKD